MSNLTDIVTSVCHLTCGRPWIDPDVGTISQPVGHLAAMDLLHLHAPWWNPFEGLGTPLAGEMQSAALFPLVILLAMPGGLVWFHISLELIAGISTYFLARRLGAPAVFAAAGGAMFALNGTYAWIGNSVLNPVAFLPMLVLGVEMIVAQRTATPPVRVVRRCARTRPFAVRGFPRGCLPRRAVRRCVGARSTLVG